MNQDIKTTVEIWDMLIASTKFKKSDKKCIYVFQKGKNEGERCKTNLDEGNTSGYCSKHCRYNKE